MRNLEIWDLITVVLGLDKSIIVKKYDYDKKYLINLLKKVINKEIDIVINIKMYINKGGTDTIDSKELYHILNIPDDIFLNDIITTPFYLSYFKLNKVFDYKNELKLLNINDSAFENEAYYSYIELINSYQVIIITEYENNK